MGKGNLNPADAYRKAQRKKELKKNKTERAKARDFALVKKDTTDLEEEVEKLEASGEDKARLSELKDELEKINKKKEEYVKEHPEQRNLVYRRRRRQQDGEAKTENALPQKRNLFNKKGLPRRPERSIYYDPVMNPYGVPPPGMPYIERPLQPDEIESEAESGDDDIPIPAGLPPGTELVQSDDEIFMPDGPPPSEMNASPGTPSVPSENIPPPPAPLPGTSAVLHLPPPPPPPGFPPNMFPPPPFPPNMPFSHPPPGMPMQLGIPYPPVPSTPLPPPPIGFFPRHQSTSSLQDPLSSVPHTTYQAHRAGQTTPQVSLPSHPSLPPKPVAAVQHANATVSAEPQLRDFKKEATSFVPTSLSRKKVGGKAGSAPKVNAAPVVSSAQPGDESEMAESQPSPARPDLVSVLKDRFGSAPNTRSTSDDQSKMESGKNDDYAKFMEEMTDIL